MNNVRIFFLLGLGIILSILPLSAATITRADSLILKSFWEYAREKRLTDLSVDKRIPLIGRFFLGSPYKAGTLNVTAAEMPVINLRELDCVTLVENTLALALLEKYDDTSIETFVENIVRLRYRNGEILDYTSRLHYSTDWLFEMEKQHFLKDVTRQIGGIRYPVRVFFMSKNYTRYPGLVADPTLIPKMKSIETAINQRTYYYIPKEEITRLAVKIAEGDILLITTGIRGLDTSHLGIAVRKDKKLYLLHASSTARKVTLTEVPLEEYMAGISSQTGIIVARMARVLDANKLALP